MTGPGDSARTAPARTRRLVRGNRVDSRSPQLFSSFPAQEQISVCGLRISKRSGGIPDAYPHPDLTAVASYRTPSVRPVGPPTSPLQGGGQPSSDALAARLGGGSFPKPTSPLALTLPNQL